MFSRTHGPKKRLFDHKSYPGAVPKACPLNGDHRYLSFMLCTPDCPGARTVKTSTDRIDFIPCCSNERHSSRLGSNEGQKSQKASENLKNELRLRGVPTDIKKHNKDPFNKKKNRQVEWYGPPRRVNRRRENLLRCLAGLRNRVVLPRDLC